MHCRVKRQQAIIQERDKSKQEQHIYTCKRYRNAWPVWSSLNLRSFNRKSREMGNSPPSIPFVRASLKGAQPRGRIDSLSFTLTHSRYTESIRTYTHSLHITTMKSTLTSIVLLALSLPLAAYAQRITGDSSEAILTVGDTV